MGAYDSQLESLRAAEMAVLDAMAEGGSALKEWEIRGRRLRFSDLADELRKIRRLISEYTALNNGQSLGPVRSRARIGY